MNPATTIAVRDINSGEFHDPAHFALLVSLDNGETARIGLATESAWGFIAGLMELASAAQERQKAMPGGPSPAAQQRLVFERGEAGVVPGTALVGLTMTTEGDVCFPFALAPEKARRVAEALLRAADRAELAVKH
jgi:hypothetical protein